MSLFKDAPKPVCWPPPKDAAGVNSLLDYARDRDPIGDKVHLMLAVLFLFTIPIYPTAASIAFGMLTFYSLVRVHVTWRCFTLIFANPIIICSALFVAWSAVSLLWSDDIDNGLGHLRSMRIFFVPFLLWPIVAHWRWLLNGLVIGVLVLNILQFVDVFQMIQHGGDISRTSGSIGGHPPTAGLWCAASTLVILGTLNKLPSWQFFASLIAMTLASIGCVVASGRGNLIGLVLAFGLFALIRFRSKKSLTLIFTTLITVTILCAIVWNLPKVGLFLQQRIHQAFSGFNSYVQDDNPRSSTGIRLAWWSSSIRAVQEHPLIGVGLGGFSAWTIEDEGFASYKERWPKWTEKSIVGASHTHSMYMSVLAEGGLIGLLLFLALILYSAISCWRIRNHSVWGAIICSLLMLWLIAGFFDSFHYHAQTLSLFCFIITLTMYFGLVAPLNTIERGSA